MTPIEQRRFLRKVQFRLRCPRAIRIKFINDFKFQLSDYLEQNPESSQKDIIALFGSPRAIADRYLAELKPEVMQEYKKHRRIIMCSVILAFAVLLSTLFAVITHERPGKIYESPVTAISTTL